MKQRALLLCALVAFLSAAAPAPGAPAEASIKPTFCQSCGILYVFGQPVAATCVDGGTTFEGCSANGNTCTGSSCGWAAAHLPDLLTSYAASGDMRSVEAVLQTFPRNATLVEGGRAILITDCDGNQIALVAMTSSPSFARVARS